MKSNKKVKKVVLNTSLTEGLSVTFSFLVLIIRWSMWQNPSLWLNQNKWSGKNWTVRNKWQSLVLWTSRNLLLHHLCCSLDNLSIQLKEVNPEILSILRFLSVLLNSFVLLPCQQVTISTCGRIVRLNRNSLLLQLFVIPACLLKRSLPYSMLLWLIWMIAVGMNDVCDV